MRPIRWSRLVRSLIALSLVATMPYARAATPPAPGSPDFPRYLMEGRCKARSAPSVCAPRATPASRVASLLYDISDEASFAGGLLLPWGRAPELDGVTNMLRLRSEIALLPLTVVLETRFYF